LELPERVALVTGGGTGIGKAVARAMAQEGARVVIAARDWARLEAVAEELRAEGHSVLPVAVDVTDKAGNRDCVNRIREHWGRVDILVNNAGASGMTPMDEADDGLWHAIVDTNLTGVYLLTKEVLGIMGDDGHGRIINMSSVLGKFGVPGYAAYCASKHGLIGFTRALALELVSRGITVNALCPGWVDTEMSRTGIEQIAERLGTDPESFKQQALAAVPIRRFLDPVEIARFAVYLASDKASGITGQALNICGGQTMV